MTKRLGLLVLCLLAIAAPAYAGPTYLGDFPTSALVYCSWNTNDQTGASITRATDGTLKVYKNDSVTERTSLVGVTQTEDFDAATGVHWIKVDTSDNTDAGFYAAGNEYNLVMTGMVIDTKTVNAAICSFSIERSGGALALAKSGVKISSGTGAGQINLTSGRVGVNWGDVTNQSTSVNLSATTVNSVNSLTGNVPANISNSGTAQAGCTPACATITLATSASTVANFYNGQTIQLTGGTGSGQTCTVTSYSTGRVATCTANWATAPDGTTTYTVIGTGPTTATVSGNVTVGAYAAGQGPNDLILVTPANKLTTDASGRIQVQDGTGTGQIDTASGRVVSDFVHPIFDVYKKGSTSVVYNIFIADERTGAGLTGLSSGSSGLTWYYCRPDQGNNACGAVTIVAGTRGSYLAGGFVEKDATNAPGIYEIGLPNASIGSGAAVVTHILKGVANMSPVMLQIALVDNYVTDVASDTTAIKTKTDQLAFTTANQVDARVNTWLGTAPNALVSGRVDSSTGAMAANVLTATAIANDAITDAKVAADVTIASAGSVTGAVGSVTAPVTVGTNNDKTGYGLADGAITAAKLATGFATFRRNVASQPRIAVIFRSSSTPTSFVTGLGTTWTMQVSKDGAALATATGTKTEVGSGLYEFAPSQADMDCDSCVFWASGTGAVAYQVPIVTR